MSQSTSFEQIKSRFLNAAVEAFKAGEISRRLLLRYLVSVSDLSLKRAYELSLQYKPNPYQRLRKVVGSPTGEMGELLHFDGSLESIDD